MSTDWISSYVSVTWQDFASITFNLGKIIKKERPKLDLIVAIARGGLTVSQLLSDTLALPIATFTVKSYKDLQQEQVPHITHGLGATLDAKKILLVDDIADSGKTFLRGIEYVQELGVKKEDITTASLHYKPHSVYKPDFFVVETTKWVIYPSEVTETMSYLVKVWQEEHISQEDITKRLQELHFPHEQITYFFEQNHLK